MTAQVTMITGEAKHVLTIPLAAVEQNPRQQSTVRVLEQGHAKTRLVTLGLKDGLNVEVLHGLQEGEEIILGDSVSSGDATAKSEHMMPPPPGP